MTDEIVRDDESKPNSISDQVGEDNKFKKLLSQRKADQEKLRDAQSLISDYEEKEKIANEDRLKEQSKFKELYESKQTELAETIKENTSLQKNMIDSAKLQAVVDALPSQVKKKEYMSFIDVDAVEFDTESRSISLESVEAVKNSFIENYGDLLKPSNTKKLPNDAAGAGGQTMSIDTWNGSTLADKKKNLAEMVRLDNLKRQK